MVKRYTGGIISSTPPTITANSTGVFAGIAQAIQYVQVGNFSRRPDPPTSITASATGALAATVSFTSPVSNGGLNITSYIVTSSPGNITATGSSSPIIVTGLTAGVTYTFTVTAVNALGGTISAPSNSILPVNATSTVEYLVVAGGGSGGTDNGGGGGAGGYLTASNFPVSTGSAITITVGAGGSAGSGGSNGSNSVFSSITAIGGGGGGNDGGVGLTGGSGGGGSSGSGGSGTPGQGNSGGTGGGVSGGGGGGASQAGSVGPGGNSKGGDGSPSLITTANVIYAGGGGGTRREPAGRQGGAGGGGTGSQGTPGAPINATSGAAGTGGGGGGGPGTTPFPRAGGNGGSGIVVVRYSDTFDNASSAPGGSLTVAGGFKIYTFTSSGSITF